MSETEYQRGDLVFVRREDCWERGIITDVFRGDVTGVEVVVVGGNGYYAETHVFPVPVEAVEPQSLRA